MVGLLALMGCGSEPAPEGYERWSGGGASFVYPEDWEGQDRPAELKAAEGAFRRGATAGDAVMTFVFASHDARNHVALVVTSTRGAARDLDEEAILDSLALE